MVLGLVRSARRLSLPLSQSDRLHCCKPQPADLGRSRLIFYDCVDIEIVVVEQPQLAELVVAG